MTDYLLGIGWLIFSTLICYGLGAAIRRQTASFAQNLVVGYMAYSFILAMLIVPIQLLARSLPRWLSQSWLPWPPRLD